MQQQSAAGHDTSGLRTNRVARIGALALLVYGAAGIALNLRLPALLAVALPAALGTASFRDSPVEVPGLDPLVAHYAARPWLPWAAWLAGLALLVWVARRGAPRPAPEVRTADAAPATLPAPAELPRRRFLLPLLGLAVLAALLAVGAYARLNLLVPQARGLTQYPYDDEGVYAGVNQLFLQGILPYRDYFFAHPPLAVLVYTPALLYHFTAWGSVTSFMIARYLSVAYSLAALAVFFLIGWELGLAGARAGAARWRPLLFGATAAALWAIDERAIEINRKIMLDQPMILASLLAIWVYLRWVRGVSPRLGRWLLVAAGVLAAASAFTKVQGVVCAAALGLDLLLRVRRAGPRAPGRATPADLLSFVGGFAGVALVVLGPFLLIAPSAFIRMVGFFQLLRPADGLRLPSERIANLTSTLENGATAYVAALGFLALTGWIIALYRWPAPATEGAAADRTALGSWRPILLWSFLSVLLFTYSRSFYGHYYVQLGAALCLLAPAAWLPLLAPSAARPRRWAAAYALLLVPALLLVRPAWVSFTTRYDDPIFAIVARYVNDAVPPGAQVLSSDEQFNFLASRPPSVSPTTGYLIDSYGHMIYLGLNMPARSWGDLIGAVIGGQASNDPYQIMWRAAPQADFLARAESAALVVVHDRGFVRLQQSTVDALLALGVVRERQSRYLILQPRSAR